MRYAEAGYYLEVDLATGNIERVATDPKLMQLHLGGLGTSVKEHWDRVPPEVKAFDPENLLIFSTGLLNGTPVFSFCLPLPSMLMATRICVSLVLRVTSAVLCEDMVSMGSIRQCKP